MATPLADELDAPASVAPPEPPPVLTPAITWKAPAAIVEGQALDGTQLAATTSVRGTFSYWPEAGTVLAVGTHILSATFTPLDTTRYAKAAASVTLAVTASSASPFVGPASGGGWKGTVRDGQLVYNGHSYPIVDGTVVFPDCTTYLVAFRGSLIKARSSAASCGQQ
jgi:hypothetical protein